MWSFNLSQLVLASVATVSFFGSSQAQTTGDGISNTTAASIFVSPQQDIAFGLNVPEDSETDLIFSLMMPLQSTWAAVGLGSNQMAGALILMAYPSSTGLNVTLSPRLGHGHTEPTPVSSDSGISVQALPGTGLLNGTTYVFNGRCGNCRSWSSKGNSANTTLDVSSREAPMLYATGPTGQIRSDSPSESVKIHWNYGTFSMDLVRATGSAGVPAMPTTDDTALSAGAVLRSAEQGMRDTAATAHAVIMVLSFVGLYPFGVLVLRLGGWVRWHAANQGLALVLVIIGSSLGFKISGTYLRTKNFNTAHQVIGILIFIFIFVQFALGFLHHRTYKQTQQTTKLAPVHVWLGRFIILMGVINGFIGFPLALSPDYNYVLAGLVLFIFPGFALIIVTKNLIRKYWKKGKEASGEPANGYDMEPWKQPQPPKPMYAGAGQQSRDAGRPAGLGVQQNAQEYV
ncbi:hypothetical protein F5X96DRAFT_647977 [Biscogniauxia mediterranea]|nr:hypothetical protein F5X96DRAFT_647977 [Biscogniauxia mediterranea]